MKKFKVVPSNALPSDNLINQIRENIANIPDWVCPSSIGYKYNGEAWILSAGPSLKRRFEEGYYTKEFFEDKFVIAVKHSMKVLPDYGVIPDYVLNVDPRPITKESTHGEVRQDLFLKMPEESTLLVSSQSDPNLYKLMKDTHKVVGWHALIGEVQQLIEGGEKIYWPIAGGTCSALRAAEICHLWGFKKMRLVGMDSSYDENELAKKDKMPEGLQTVTLKGPDGQPIGYKTTGELVAQYQDLQNMLKMPNLPYEITLEGTWHGDSLIGTLKDVTTNKTLKPFPFAYSEKTYGEN